MAKDSPMKETIMIDTRGLACPTPVLRTKQGIKNRPKEIEVLVDNTTSRKNVERYLKCAGYIEFDFIDRDESDILIKAKL